MSVRIDLIGEFNFLGASPSESVLDKCEEACALYDISPESFVELWAAHIASNNGLPDLTLDTITVMIRKELKSRTKTKRNEPVPKEIDVYDDPMENNDADVLETYSDGRTPKRNTTKITNKSIGGTPTRLIQSGISPKGTFSPASYSPTVAQSSTKYAERTNSLTKLTTYGSEELLARTKFVGDGTKMINFTLYGPKDYWLTANTNYMYTSLLNRKNSKNNVTTWLGSYLIRKHNLSKPTSISEIRSSPVVLYGRIVCEGEGHLNKDSLLLEYTEVMGDGVTLPIDMSFLQQYTVFPGEVVAVEGVNLLGKRLVAHKMYSDAKLPLPKEIPKIHNDGLQIITACGPFTLLYNLTYEPLQDLMKYVCEHKPDVLILIGPFIDSEHPCVSGGTMAVTFDDFFESLIETIMDHLKELNTQVVMVCSQRDAHHHNVYPTPPYVTRNTYKNLHFVSDPSMLNFDGVIVGVTATDILFHISKEEISSSNLTLDRMGRFCTKVLEQQSFYPLFPPNVETSMDGELFEKCGIFAVTPHILILPSSFRYFIKNIQGTVVINPERLSKGNVGGTFSQFKVYPTNSDSLANSLAAEILHI